MTIRIAITDDHEVVRAGLVQFLEMNLDIVVALEASNGVELLKRLPHKQVDLLLLDMSMPGIDGAGLIRHIKKLYPSLTIMVLSMHEEPEVVKGALNAGASGYIGKSCSPKLLLEAIRQVIATGKYLTPSMAEKLAYYTPPPDATQLLAKLSDREMEVLGLLVAGKSSNEIAAELLISNKTVSAHKRNIQSKLNMKGLAELVRYVVENKLI
jgi:DNA-binding NarL/FixJ family response regulator